MRIETDGQQLEVTQPLREYVEEVKASGFVASLIARHGVKGLSVAPAA